MAARPSGNVRVGVQVEGIAGLRRALKAVGDTDAPFLRTAVAKGGDIFGGEARRYADGGIAQGVQVLGVKGSGVNVRAVVKVVHPGARSEEFGRKFYWTGYKLGTGKGAKGRKHVGGTKRLHLPGQKAKPFIGIISGGKAQDAARPQIAALLTEAVSHEWDRLGGD